MKRIILLSIINLCCLNMFSQQKSIVHISENLWMDATEVSNSEWKKYMKDLEKEYGKSSSEYQSAKPDITVWTQFSTDFEFEANNYFQNNKYSKYPVVGISWQQAVDFCKWRNSAVKDKQKLFRLPSEQEWELAAGFAYSDKIQKTITTKNIQKISLHNFKVITTEKIQNAANPKATLTAPVYSFFPNEKGVFNLFGNVAEMTQTEGVAKGGGWLHTAEESGVKAVFNYSEPNAWLGFRCVCEKQ
jgi:formylglycine-generating enzyme required for sulfatase activity